MKTIVRILAVTSLAFALSTAYLAHALKQQRALTARMISSTAPQSATKAEGAPATNSTNTAQPAGSDPAADADSKAAGARERLGRYNDPAQRAKILAANRSSLVETWKTIALSMQLSPQELDRILDQLAEQAMRFDQRRLECQIDPACDLQALNALIREEVQQNRIRMLGPDGMEKWNAYVYAIPERVYIDELRRDLSPELALGDAEAERLVMALADERRRYVAHVAHQGRKIQMSAGFTVQEFLGDVAPKPFGPSNKAMTAEFNDRLRSRAAQNLSTGQLDAFRKLQDERLKSAARMESLLQLSGK